jgi:hypothetical protein
MAETPAPPAPAPSQPAPTPPPPSPAPTPPPSQPAADTKAVPYDRFKEVNERAKQAEKELSELQAWKEQQENERLSELERATKRAEQAEQKAQQLEERATQLERSGWVRSAAQAAGFTDVEDALAFVDLSALKDADKAKAAVQDLAERKPHLLNAEAPPAAPAAFGAPLTAIPGGNSDDPKLDLGRGLLAFASRNNRK